ncbi:MAG: methyltransferase [Alphaproteobacteria bacterium]|nr:methyltransferase [Alphaproteobacteria bacterium]
MHQIVKLLPGRHKRAKAGHPWIFSNEIAERDTAMEIDAGTAVTVVGDNGETYGTALFNPYSLVAGRLVDRKTDVAVDGAFFADRLGRALALRNRLFGEPFYRLVHAEADGLPGLVIDRYGDAAVLQLNAAGMDVRRDMIIDALDALVPLNTIVLRNDSPSRLREELSLEVSAARGAADAAVPVRENGATFAASLAQGQKTGWFFDQRENRAFIASLARDAGVIDFYAYGGGFGVQALVAGAAEAVLVDRSAAALESAAESAVRNGVAARCQLVKADAFEEMERRAADDMRYGIVIADPPAFVKSKKDLHRGSRAYRKMVRLAARLVAPGGILFVASCSHNVAPGLFGDLVQKGLSDAHRSGRILRAAGAAPDHPVHPGLPETAYLKSLTLQLD